MSNSFDFTVDKANITAEQLPAPMTRALSFKDATVRYRSKQGMLGGSLVRLTSTVAVFEIGDPGTILQASEVLPEFEVTANDQSIYKGRAVVRSSMHCATHILCEVSLDNSSLTVSRSLTLQPEELRDRFSAFVKGWQECYRISPAFKNHVSDMQSFLIDLRLWLDGIELSTTTEGALAAGQDHLVRELGSMILPLLDELFEKFEFVAKPLEKCLREVHQSYMRRMLHPLVLCSPFAHRTFQKPLGYAGDYEMVNMILNERPAGESLYARVLDLWFLNQPPAVAHRHRIQFLEECLVKEALRARARGHSARILNIGCGPAAEVERFTARQELSNGTKFTLVDFNDDTLSYTGAKLNDARIQHSRHVSVELVRKSVFQLLKEASRPSDSIQADSYDLVYCAGLFDYLTDATCLQLMKVMYRWVAPGGLLLATNVDSCNPLRYGMEHLLDWYLIYRSSREAQGLRPPDCDPDGFKVTADITGVNVFIEARKPMPC